MTCFFFFFCPAFIYINTLQPGTYFLFRRRERERKGEEAETCKFFVKCVLKGTLFFDLISLN